MHTTMLEQIESKLRIIGLPIRRNTCYIRWIYPN